ncbi:MAG: hypothetical protein ACI4XJ_04440 [Eubacteriales bacterium]
MKTDYPYIIAEQHTNVSGDPSPIFLHEAYTSDRIYYDGNDLVFPMLNGFILRPNCYPNKTDRYLQTGDAEIRLRNVKNILDRSGRETPCVGQQFTFLRHEYHPETGVFTLEVLNRYYGQVVFDFLCDAVEYRFSSMEDTSWMQQTLDSLNKDRKG